MFLLYVKLNITLRLVPNVTCNLFISLLNSFSFSCLLDEKIEIPSSDEDSSKLSKSSPSEVEKSYSESRMLRYFRRK